ncbi:hypothetical protein K9S39_06240 [Streptomyces halobius]|uniref:Secreted protein n=1 Tax=Streptomyces halobius TaxID=2879846 RepID=A0ABY4MKQ1_9ACTN|nr:hypothetical protein [Streptomyces halobius]UQA98167.1 hypothetical protein K9S39_03305 [Streptomyces halobius]UQA98175.1 hypothetical protein K9S39_06240 [Streptomyces halobius]
MSISRWRLLGLSAGGRCCPAGLVVAMLGLVRRGQHLTHPRAGDGPFLPVLLGQGQLGLDPVSLLPQLVHPTASGELALFQQPHD